MENISGISITKHQDSKRIIDIRIEDEILDKLISVSYTHLRAHET